ncbi:calpain-11-like [Armigeres subalbatus]|uniref:calpain-11-like n=1 Tax=Armigeres subalbatus TaxID=124917 RepID=UPI002ED4D11C
MPAGYRANGIIHPSNGHISEFSAYDNKGFQSNGGPKVRSWINGSADHQSTLSRPRSAEVITANGHNGTIPNGRPHNGINGMNGINGINCMNGINGINGGPNGVVTRGPGGLHEDLEFPPSTRTLSKKKQIVWMRPHDMCGRPMFRLSPPGLPLSARELPEPVGPGDPSLTAALGCLSQLPRLLERVVPPEQTFDTSNGYCGMFKFRFWQWGKWVEVRVDDRLPTRGDRPAHMHCAQPDVFWASLLEKAYAKLYGGYAFLKFGTVGRALQDLTGAVVQSVPPSGPLLGGAVPRSTLLVAISGLEKETKRRRSGLLSEHPYSVTGLARVRANSSDSSQTSGQSGDTSLIRLRSPWIGGEWGGVWCGAWSERSWEWNALNERDRELLSSRSSNDCEFWMSVSEFLSRFVVIWLAHIGPDDWALEPGLHTRTPWRAALAVRQWRAGFNAGGPHKFIETTATNPQFRIRVPAGHPAKAHVVVAVSQKYECYRSRNFEDEEIGFTIYEVPPGMQRVTPQYVSEQMPLDFAPLSNLREIATFFALPAGDFVVMPHSQQHREGRFLLRIFADQHTDVWEVNEENLVIHNIAAEFCDERTIDARILYKLRSRYPHEIDSTQLQAILKAHGGNNRGFRGLGGINCGPSLELCRGMLALRDPALGGRLSIEHVPALIGLMRFWKAAFRRCGPSSSGTATLSRGIWASKVSSYCLRGLLWAGGATASNKVLEALVSRFTRNRQITLEGYLLSMARLHLAHERYHSLDAKAKASPLSLEEMILMTIYS